MKTFLKRAVLPFLLTTQANAKDCIEKIQLDISIEDIPEDSFSESWHLEDEKTILLEQLLSTSRQLYEQEL